MNLCRDEVQEGAGEDVAFCEGHATMFAVPVGQSDEHDQDASATWGCRELWAGDVHHQHKLSN